MALLIIRTLSVASRDSGSGFSVSIPLKNAGRAQRNSRHRQECASIPTPIHNRCGVRHNGGGQFDEQFALSSKVYSSRILEFLFLEIARRLGPPVWHGRNATILPLSQWMKYISFVRVRECIAFS